MTECCKFVFDWSLGVGLERFALAKGDPDGAIPSGDQRLSADIVNYNRTD